MSFCIILQQRRLLAPDSARLRLAARALRALAQTAIASVRGVRGPTFRTRLGEPPCAATAGGEEPEVPAGGGWDAVAESRRPNPSQRPGISAGSMSPWRRQPATRSHVRARATSRGP